MRRGAKARLVGEQPARHAKAHGLLHGHTRNAARHGLRLKRQHKHLRQRAGQRLGVDDQNGDAAQNVKRRHDRHDFFRYSGDSLHAAQKDERRNGCHDDANHQPVYAECIVERIADRVRLHHVAHKAQRQNNKHRKDGCQHLADLALERGADIKRRAAGHMAVHRGTVVLRQHGLCIDGGHAEKRRHPCPEQRARAAADQCGGAARDVAGANLRRNGGRQRLKAAHALGISLFAAQRKAAEHPAKPLAKAAHLHAAQPHGKVDARADQQKQQQRVPQNIAELLDPCRKYCHVFPLLLHHFTFCATAAAGQVT